MVLTFAMQAVMTGDHFYFTTFYYQ